MSELKTQSPLVARRSSRSGDHWTDGRLNYLRRRWWQGGTAQKIAQELGGVTRASVLGKVRRLGLVRARRRSAQHAARSTRPAASARGALRSGLRLRAKVIAEAQEGRTGLGMTSVPASLDRASVRSLLFRPRAETAPVWVRNASPYVDNSGVGAEVPIAQRRDLVDLDIAVCRWPFGDPASPGFFFCGAPALPEKPYCAEHCAKAYVRSNPIMRIRNRTRSLPLETAHDHVGSKGDKPR